MDVNILTWTDYDELRSRVANFYFIFNKIDLSDTVIINTGSFLYDMGSTYEGWHSVAADNIRKSNK